MPLPVEVRTALRAYLDERGAVALTVPLFPAQRSATAGLPIRPQAVWDVVKKCARLAQLEDVTPHVLRQCEASRSVARDTYATATLETSGHDLRLVQHLLGHSRIETTARYLKPSPEAAEAAANGLSAWLEDAELPG
ncbi:MAG: tyrosine-type recombinase/integrase [Chloroflexi bacterium]|nr:tyrosine-type recombinase/integrase [Chloroflexota bacterium]MBU1879446.1 tyrosine-type recombinase/integrase [Chloroflexota bacterium]